MSYTRFIEGPRKRKTRTWYVQPIEHTRGNIGTVAWFARWRCYAFFPRFDTVFEKRCLRDIADFCEEQTAAHRSAPPVPLQ